MISETRRDMLLYGQPRRSAVLNEHDRAANRGRSITRVPGYFHASIRGRRTQCGWQLTAGSLTLMTSRWTGAAPSVRTLLMDGQVAVISVPSGRLSIFGLVAERA